MGRVSRRSRFARHERILVGAYRRRETRRLLISPAISLRNRVAPNVDVGVPGVFSHPSQRRTRGPSFVVLRRIPRSRDSFVRFASLVRDTSDDYLKSAGGYRRLFSARGDSASSIRGRSPRRRRRQANPEGIYTTEGGERGCLDRCDRAQAFE